MTTPSLAHTLPASELAASAQRLADTARHEAALADTNSFLAGTAHTQQLADTVHCEAAAAQAAADRVLVYAERDDQVAAYRAWARTRDHAQLTSAKSTLLLDTL